ncbi:MAG: SDR family oxidoreductase [Acidobacteriota bacterium]|nr:SDR family oxidoreductase [Acidobacteriota bacterium]
MRFENKVIWITGASSGIGEALAYAFSREGAKLILSGRREAELERVKRGCADAPENIFVLPLDLVRFETFADKAKQAEARFGRVDILVNNGGISHRSLVAETLFDVELAVMNTNYFGSIALAKAVLPAMLARGSGHIVVISSLMGYLDTPLRSAYAASKHALHGYFDSLRAEVWRQNVKVTLICPGFVKTQISLNALTADGTKHAKMDNTQAKGISADACAAKTLNAIARGREEVMIGGPEVLAVYIKRFLPWLYSRVIRRIRLG